MVDEALAQNVFDAALYTRPVSWRASEQKESGKGTGGGGTPWNRMSVLICMPYLCMLFCSCVQAEDGRSVSSDGQWFTWCTHRSIRCVTHLCQVCVYSHAHAPLVPLPIPRYAHTLSYGICCLCVLIPLEKRCRSRARYFPPHHITRFIYLYVCLNRSVGAHKL